MIKLKCARVGEEEFTLNEKRQEVEKRDFWSWENEQPTVRLYPLSGKSFLKGNKEKIKNPFSKLELILTP